jgi:hypothetical protein
VTCAGFTGGLQEISNIDGLELSKEEKLEMLTGLDGDIYPMKGVARPLLIRLNEFVLNRLDQSYVQYDVKVRPARSRAPSDDYLLVVRAFVSQPVAVGYFHMTCESCQHATSHAGGHKNGCMHALVWALQLGNLLKIVCTFVRMSGSSKYNSCF